RAGCGSPRWRRRSLGSASAPHLAGCRREACVPSPFPLPMIASAKRRRPPAAAPQGGQKLTTKETRCLSRPCEIANARAGAPGAKAARIRERLIGQRHCCSRRARSLLTAHCERRSVARRPSVPSPPRLDIDSMIKPPFRSWADVRNAWKTLAGYERFEVVVALLLRGVIGIIIVVALYRLIAGVVDTILLRALNPLDHVVFQQVFGAIMTLLIALEFNHTLRYVAPGARGIIQARIVILIALLALARKIIVADLFEIAPAELLGLAALSLSLGVTYWLVRDTDEGRRRRKDGRAPSASGPV